ncbi:MAG: hypothetical protein ACKV2V_00120 [Blastocatellia bacterium]
MKTNTRSRNMLLSGLALALMFTLISAGYLTRPAAAAPVAPVALNVQASASAGFAMQGNLNAANILVVVTGPDGAPVTDLAQADFSVINHFTLPGQVCGFSNNITSFVNAGTGAYRIRVGLPGGGGCAWVHGDYLGQARIESGTRKGQAPFVLSIP